MTEPSATMLVICLTAFVISTGLGVWLFTPSSMAGLAGAYVPRSGRDGDGFATVNAIRLAHHRGEGVQQLVVLGSSNVAQSLGSEKKLASLIKDRTGQAWEVHLLATPLQSPWDQLKLLETVVAGRKPTDGPLIVAIGISPLRMGWNRERLLKYEDEQRIGLRSTWVDEEVRALGAQPRPRTGWYLWDNRRFVLLNGSEALMRFAVRRPAVRKIDYFAEDDRPKPVAQRRRDNIMSEFRNGSTNAQAFLAIYRRLGERLAAMPNVKVVYIEEALSPGIVKQRGLADEMAARNAMIGDFAARNDAAYWRIISDAALTDDDFYDDVHILRGAPQEKVRTAFASRFEDYLKTQGRAR